jgi:acyl dehydratase
MFSLEDFKIGQVFELGQRQVSADDIIEFAEKYDPQPFHMDPEAARDSIFGELVASGWHTAVIFMRLLVDGLLLKSHGNGSPGLDELRWWKPVKPGDTLLGRFTVLETRISNSRPEVGIVRGRGEMLNQNGELVMSLVSIGFFGRQLD